MAKYKIILHYSDGTSEEEDDIFDSEQSAADYANYLIGCAQTGAEILHMSNPGDYSLDDYEEPEYEVVEIDD